MMPIVDFRKMLPTPVHLTLLMLVLFALNIQTLDAQRTRRERVETSCNIPREEKNIVAVSSFRNTAAGRNSWSVGQGMADMLSNALLNSGCFRVVDRQTIDDILQEQNFANSGRVNQNTAASIGNLTGAQLIVTGNVTEFKENESGGLVGGLINNAPGGMGMVKAHVGFIIQIIDANTGELLVSESIERKKNKVGAIAGARVGSGAVVGGGFFSSKAMEDALEEAIIDAVAFLAEQRSNLPPPPVVETIEGEAATIEIQGIGYQDLRRLDGLLQDQPTLTQVEKRLESGNGILDIFHTGSIEDVLDFILDRSGMNLEVIELDRNYVKLKAQ